MRKTAITNQMIKDYISQHTIELRATQHQLCVPIINRIYQKMASGIRFDDIKVCEGLIIDGHHRYLCSLLAETGIGQVPSHKTSATTPFTWNEVEFVDVEWDTPEKIEKLNRDDAFFNNIPLNVIIELTK